ncbi:MAG: helix-turn-helix domain-containing protein [Betaproteobacteria bacterium]|nr:helix-turn-helix domain-containing protein [Betaproteobacteria bacterium]
MTELQPGPVTAGSMLRAAREKQGLHIAALAAAIKVSPRKLEALESGRHEELPDATFVRALAQTVCRTLKIDAKPVLDLLPPAPSMALEPGSGGLGTPFRERPGRSEPGLSPSSVRPLVWAAAVLVLVAVAVVFVPVSWWARLTSATPVANVSSRVAPAAPVSVAVPVEVNAAASAPSAAADGVVPAPPAGDAKASQAMVETVFSSPLADASASAAAAVAGILQLRCAEESWVEVRDARGQSLLSRNVQPGESVGLDGALPLRVTIGNAAATQLAFRGQPVSLSGRTRDNVARLELP